MDRSPSSHGLLDSSNTGTTPSIDMAGEGPQVQVGAQPEPGEPSQEPVVEQQVSWSQELAAQSSQDIVPAVPAGNSPCLEMEVILETPRSFLHLQEAAVRQPPPSSNYSLVEGEI